VILAVCADKGAPGVSTAATALSVVWPGERVLLEADPSGGDLALRLRSPQGGELAADRSVTSLAADAREEVAAGALARYAQPTSLGFPVLVAPLSAEAFEPMARLWPQVAAAAQAWPGAVIADLGRLQLRHASSPLAAAGTAVLLVTRAQTREDLYHARERAHELALRLGQGQHGRSPLSVAVICPARDARGAVSQVQQALASQADTSTIPVIGSLAEDRRGVEGLRAGEVSKRLLGSDLLKSARTLTERLTGWFPELVGMPSPPVMPGSPRHGYGAAWHPGPDTAGEQYRARWGSAAGATPGGAA
jgi:hypothetical protein